MVNVCPIGTVPLGFTVNPPLSSTVVLTVCPAVSDTVAIRVATVVAVLLNTKICDATFSIFGG